MQWLWLNKNVLKRDKARVIKESVLLRDIFEENGFVYFKTDEFSNTFCFSLEKGKGGQYVRMNERVFIYFWNCSTQYNPETLYVKKIEKA